MKLKADNIYINGHIYTQDINLPWATTVACCDGKILAVGDYNLINEYSSNECTIVDLEGKYLFPGFIEIYTDSISDYFQGDGIELDELSIRNALREITDDLCDRGIASIDKFYCDEEYFNLVESQLQYLISEEEFYQRILFGIMKGTIPCSDENAKEKSPFDLMWTTSSEEEESVYQLSDDAKDAVNRYTKIAAENIGKIDQLGSIEPGKLADFTVFNDNPITLGLDQMEYMHAELLILNGQVVYDAEEAAKDELYNILLTQQL